jgi:hypothetical protein
MTVQVGLMVAGGAATSLCSHAFRATIAVAMKFVAIIIASAVFLG